MNESEKICYEWIREKNNLTDDDIIFSHHTTPDFQCVDGSKYEAKRLYGQAILIYTTQTENLADSTIVVVDLKRNKVIKTFKWEDRDSINFPKIKIIDYDKDSKPVRIRVETLEKLEKIDPNINIAIEKALTISNIDYDFLSDEIVRKIVKELKT